MQGGIIKHRTCTNYIVEKCELQCNGNSIKLLSHTHSINIIKKEIDLSSWKKWEK